MSRTITVKGIGKASAKPDFVVVSMTIESKDAVYDRAMDLASEHIRRLRESVEAAGFAKDVLKTANFNVRTNYESVRDESGNYRQEFDGYVVSHNLKLEFDFDSGRLSQALAAVAGCVAKPELNIAFTVKDKTAVHEEMLRSAAENARKKAKILCEASSVGLGKLLKIEYNWGEQSLLSNTRYGFAEECVAAPMMARSIDIEPEDIHVSDTATFVWRIDGLGMEKH